MFLRPGTGTDPAAPARRQLRNLFIYAHLLADDTVSASAIIPAPARPAPTPQRYRTASHHPAAELAAGRYRPADPALLIPLRGRAVADLRLKGFDPQTALLVDACLDGVQGYLPLTQGMAPQSTSEFDYWVLRTLLDPGT